MMKQKQRHTVSNFSAKSNPTNKKFGLCCGKKKAYGSGISA